MCCPGALSLLHSSRLLSRDHPRGLSDSYDRGTGELSAELFDKLPPRQLGLGVRVLALLSIFSPLKVSSIQTRAFALQLRILIQSHGVVNEN